MKEFLRNKRYRQIVKLLDKFANSKTNRMEYCDQIGGFILFRHIRGDISLYMANQRGLVFNTSMPINFFSYEKLDALYKNLRKELL